MRRLTFAREARGDAEPSQPHLGGRLVEQDVGWLDIFMDEPALMKLPERRGSSDGERQEASYVHRHAEQPLQRLAARILEDQRGSTSVAYEVQRLHRPRPAEF